MAQVEGYDSRLATELEKLWREKMLAGAAQDFKEAIARELEPIRALVTEASQAHSGRLNQLDHRLGTFGEIDQKLDGLIAQIASGAQQFTIASQQMSAIPGIVAATSELTNKIGKIDSYIEHFDRRANQPNSFAEISKIVDARDLDSVDKVNRIRSALTFLQQAETPPAKRQRVFDDTFWRKAIIPAALILTLLVAVAALAFSGVLPVKWPADRSLPVQKPAQPKPDGQLVREGWAILKAKSPDMAKRVEQNCALRECDVVQIVASDFLKKSKSGLGNEIFQIGRAVPQSEAPGCEYDSNDALLNGARGGARPESIRACLISALAAEAAADEPLTAQDYGAHIKAYLIAIGRAGNPAGAVAPLQGGLATSSGNTLENSMAPAAPAATASNPAGAATDTARPEQER